VKSARLVVLPLFLALSAAPRSAVAPRWPAGWTSDAIHGAVGARRHGCAGPGKAGAGGWLPLPRGRRAGPRRGGRPARAALRRQQLRRSRRLQRRTAVGSAT